MKWHPTPLADLNTVHVFEGETWRPCELKDVKPDDMERDDACVAIVDGWPMKNDGEHGRDYGYCCSVVVYDTMAALQARGLS